MTLKTEPQKEEPLRLVQSVNCLAEYPDEVRDLKRNDEKRKQFNDLIKLLAIEVYHSLESNEEVIIPQTVLPIEHIKKCFNAVAFLRQSIKNDNYSTRYNFMEKTLSAFAKANNHNSTTVFYQDLSGYWSYEYALAYLQKPHVNAIYVSEIARLSRNVEGYITITKYAYENNKEIYLNSTLVSEGDGYITGLVLAIFSEFELLAKQNKFSHYLEEVALFLKRELKFNQVKNKKARKLIKLARFTDRTTFLEKMNTKAIEVLTKYDSQQEERELRELNQDQDNNGKKRKQLVSKELKEVAIKVLEIING